MKGSKKKLLMEQVRDAHLKVITTVRELNSRRQAELLETMKGISNTDAAWKLSVISELQAHSANSEAAW